MKNRQSRLLAVTFVALSLGACGLEPDSESKGTGHAALSAVTATGIGAELSVPSDWGAGYCANVSVKNTGTTPIANWSLVIAMNGSTVGSLWSASYSANGGNLNVTPLAHTQSIPAGQSVSFGFCGNGTGRPVLVSVTGNGGTNGTGGASATGGTTAKGGSTATGGTTAKGGSAATGGATCTDIPRSTTESCENAVKWGFCGQGWFAGYCNKSCGVCSGGAGGNASTGGASSTGGTKATGGSKATGGTTATGGNSSGTSVPPLTNYSTGTTTRYWDCCKPSCGWTSNAAQGGKKPTKTCNADGTTQVSVDTQSACAGGSGFQCYSMAPWSVSDTLSYGYAATGNGNPMCGKCYQLDFTGAGDSSAASALKGKSMIVQIINIGGDVASTQFDLLIPGGGVGAFNACSNQWASSNLGAQYGGFLTSCNYSMSCVTDMCQATFGNKPELLAGCKWFTGWFNAANNPRINYAEVACPAALTAKSGM